MSPSPVFEAAIRPPSAADRARMTDVSWREGCPVALEDLRVITMPFWGFDRRVHPGGVLIVHADVAGGVVDVFRTLFELRFPFGRIEPVDAYGGDDDRSMSANNTSAFNCRLATGSDTAWSEHAFGRAIDVNPVQNPWVTRGGTVLPPEGAPYADRSDARPGMILDGGRVVGAFAAIGWEWGGHWSSVKDYQHFSESGR
jgi:hypothetical protein